MWKWTGNPLASIGDQSSPKVTPILFASCHMPKIGVLTRTYFAVGQVPDCPQHHMRIKKNSCPEIIIYAVSHPPSGVVCEYKDYFFRSFFMSY